MILHANAIPQNRPARIRTGGINCDDPHSPIFPAIVLGQLIDERTLARTGCTGKAQNSRVTGLWEQSLQQLGPPTRAVLDHADSPRQTPRIARTQLLNQWLEVVAQSVSVKQSVKGRKPSCGNETSTLTLRTPFLLESSALFVSSGINTELTSGSENCDAANSPHARSSG